MVYLPVVPAWTNEVPSDETGELARADRCRLGYVVQAGGPSMRSVAVAALAGTDADRRHALTATTTGKSPVGLAASQDEAAYPLEDPAAKAQRARWDAQVNGVVGFSWMDDASTPDFGSATHSFMWETLHFSDPLGDDLVPRASQEARDRVMQIVKQKQDSDEYLIAWGKWFDQVMQTFGAPPGTKLSDAPDAITGHMSADDARMFLEFGGFPTVAPTPGSAEFRQEVESLKTRWASCDPTNPPDPYHVLGEVVAAAQSEWQVELDGQAGQRNQIAAAHGNTWTQMSNGVAAMNESLGQSWVASTLLGWSKDKTLTAAQKTKLANALTAAKNAINVQIPKADTAVTNATAQGPTVDTAVTQAQQVAAAAHLPVGRGLAYAQQSATVTKAMIAATKATATTARAALAAAQATVATSQALYAAATAQQHALQAQYRKQAAQYAAGVAHLAAADAANQAASAAKAVTDAHAARLRAEQDAADAKVKADDAHAKRLVADKERANAAGARQRADKQRAAAQAADQQAQQQESVAATKRQQAEADANTAGDRLYDAEQAEQQAGRLRQQAIAADKFKDAMAARAETAQANQAAADSDAAAEASSDAAEAAQADADDAATAAANAHTAADQASQAAVAARAAATQAQGAAARSQAASTAATADAGATKALSADAHAAAADAVAASQRAAVNVQNAEDDLKTASGAAQQARDQAAAAAAEAGAAQTAAATAAGWAFAAGQNALGARDAAIAVADPANTAIAAASPYRQNDVSAGLTVLVGQDALSYAQQQAAVAEAASAQAAKAAAAAKKAADQAAADAKDAATAAANAAADAAATAASVKAAKQSAAQAAIEMAAALKAAADAAKYNAQAQQDAAAAADDASAAQADAQAANSAATDAERDAASAHAAADQADQQAAAAQVAADRAKEDAKKAEAAAARADLDAKAAQDAAANAEIVAAVDEQNKALGTDGITDIPGLAVIPHVKDDATRGDCLGIFDHDIRYNLTHCRLSSHHHLTGTLELQEWTCADPSQTCTGHFTKDDLGSVPVDISHDETTDILLADAAKEILPQLGKALIADYVNCVTRKGSEQVTACAWALGTIVIPFGIGKAAGLIRAVRIAMLTGDGLEEAYAAIRAAKLESSLTAALDEDLADTLAQKCVSVASVHSFAAGTLVVMDGGTRQPIEQVHAGDWVESLDTHTGQQVRSKVGVVLHNRDEDLADVTVEGPDGRPYLFYTTQHHPFWNQATHGWTDAVDLHAGDRLRTDDDALVTVESVTSRFAPADMYDLVVEQTHTFFVAAGNDGVLVHNVGECPITGLPHGAMGEAATRLRLVKVGYVRIITQVRFVNSAGKVFIADFVAQDAEGNWIAVEAKTGKGATITPNQQVGYPELDGAQGAILDTTRLARVGFAKGDRVHMHVVFDLWDCPSCS